MAEKVQANAKKVIDDSTKAIEEATAKAQDQYFSLVEQSQAAFLNGYEAFVKAVNNVDVPVVPGFEAVANSADAVKVPSDLVEGSFDLASKILDNQRTFATKLMAVSAKA